MAAAAVNLSVPAPAEDSMEMSSPGNHNLDDDIDFGDYEPNGSGVQVTDEDRMTDDGEHARPTTATDDVMEDDTQQGDQAVVQEEVMQDSPASTRQQEDEDLIDYSDDELQDEIVEDVSGAPAAAVELADPDPTSFLQDEEFDEDVVNPAGDTTFEQPTEDGADVTAAAEEDVTALLSEEENNAPQHTTDAGSNAVGGDQHQLEQVTADALQERAEEDSEDELEEQLATDDAEAHKPAISLDTTSHAPAEGPATPTDTGLHAMTLRFGDFQFPLFKSRNQPDGLLKNDNLASLSLGELIQQCRQRLTIKTGEHLSEDQDLVLGFDQLGLILVEDSRAAFEASLDEVLDVYLQLHQNDGTEDIPPFLLSLSLQLKFTSSISVLKQAAAAGQGMSSFGLFHSGEGAQVDEYDEHADGEHDREGQEDFDEHQPYEENKEGQKHQQEQEQKQEQEQEQEQATHIEGSIPEQQEADTNDYYGDPPEHTEYPEEEEYHQQDDEYQGEFDQGQYYEEHQDEATQLLDDHAREDDGQDEGFNDAVHDEASVNTAVAGESVKAPAGISVGISAGEGKSDSAATSTTFQGDDGQDQTDQTAANDTDFSTLLEGEDEASLVAGSQQGAHQQQDNLEDLTHIDEETEGQEAIQFTNLQDDVQNPDAEDYLGDLDKQQYGEAVEQPGDDAAFAEQGISYGHEHEQADETAAQHDQLTYAEHQADEEDEQFHTAYDLFDGEKHGQGRTERGVVGDDANEATLVASATNGEQHAHDDDFIDFDLDEEPIVEHDKAKAANAGAAAGSRTPLAKRSFEDLVDDEIDFDSPEPKKQRAS